MEVDSARVGNGVLDGWFGNLMKDDAFGGFGVQLHGLCQVPGDGFTFAVFIARQPDFGAFGGRFQLGDDFLFVRRDLVIGLKTVLNVDA